MSRTGITPQLADRLFWDCKKPLSEAEWQRYATAVIERVLDHGDIEDFREIAAYYGRDTMRAVFANSRRISERARAFGVALYGDELLKESTQWRSGFSQKKLWPY